MLRIATLFTGLSLLLGCLLSTSVVAAQSDAVCVLTPVELPLFDATPASEIPGALGTPASPDDPAREATDEEVAAFTDAVDVFLTCINTGEARFANAIFTERYLAAKFADPNILYQPDFEQMIADNIAGLPDAEPLVVDEITDVQVRDDGRISARVTLSSAGTSWSDTLVLKQVDEHWLIDDVILETR